jgi:hypothetical protein
MENLFSNDDLCIYRGVVCFYQGQFDLAISDFKLSQDVKMHYKILDNEANRNLESEVESEDFDELSDVSSDDY